VRFFYGVKIFGLVNVLGNILEKYLQFINRFFCVLWFQCDYPVFQVNLIQ